MSERERKEKCLEILERIARSGKDRDWVLRLSCLEKLDKLIFFEKEIDDIFNKKYVSRLCSVSEAVKSGELKLFFLQLKNTGQIPTEIDYHSFKKFFQEKFHTKKTSCKGLQYFKSVVNI